MAVFLPFVPNWRNGIRDTYEFNTSVFTSSNGTEQRRSERIQPRRTMEATVLLDGDRQRTFADALNKARDGKVQVADFTAAGARVSQTASAGSTYLAIENMPDWIVAGGVVVVMTGRRSHKITVDFVEENLVFLTTPLTDAVGAGAYIRPFIPAQLANSTTLSIQTYTVSTADISFKVEPGYVVRIPDELPFDESSAGASVQSFGPAAILFGRYVLLRRPNFLQKPEMQFNIPYETVDYSRGVVKTFTPVPMISRTLTATYLGMTYADIIAILDIFIRCKGRAGEIFVPTWGSDFPPVITAGGQTIIVEGRDFYDTYADDIAHKSALIKRKDGTLVPIEISTMELSGPNTLIHCNNAIDSDNTNIDQISWMFVSRFAQDSLTIEWVTNGVANISLSFITLANLAAESSYGSNWILATGYWRDRGQWVDSAVWED